MCFTSGHVWTTDAAEKNNVTTGQRDRRAHLESRFGRVDTSGAPAGALLSVVMRDQLRVARCDRPVGLPGSPANSADQIGVKLISPEHATGIDDNAGCNKDDSVPGNPSSHSLPGQEKGERGIVQEVAVTELRPAR